MTRWEDVTAAIGVAVGGDRATGLQLLLDCWAQTAPTEHAPRCVLAHYLADLQSELDQEITWDHTALEEHRLLQDTDLAAVGIASAAALAPSLHLNLGDGYLRRGDLDAARHHLDQGLAGAHALPPEGYGRMIRSGLHGLAHRIDTAAQTP